MTGASSAQSHVLESRTLDEFIAFMHPQKWGSGWVLVEHTSDHVSFEKSMPAQQGSCAVATLLLLLGLLPGILYMVYGRKAAKTLKLRVTQRPNGMLVPSGDAEGVAKFELFLKWQEE